MFLNSSQQLAFPPRYISMPCAWKKKKKEISAQGSSGGCEGQHNKTFLRNEHSCCTGLLLEDCSLQTGFETAFTNHSPTTNPKHTTHKCHSLTKNPSSYYCIRLRTPQFPPPRSTVSEKLTVAQRAKKLLMLSWNQEAHYRVAFDTLQKHRPGTNFPYYIYPYSQLATLP